MNRRAPLPNLALDRTAPATLHRQLVDGLRRAIHGGDLATGAILPSSRALAETLGVSRNTVVTAYDELTAEGLLTARRGSATRVLRGSAVPSLPDWRGLLRAAQYPVDPVRFRDPDGNAIYFHR